MASGEIDVIPGRVLSPEELITTQKLNDLGAPTLRIKELTITARELADGSINSDKLDVDLEAQLGIPDNSITTNKIVDSAVTTNKIVADVTLRTTSGATYRPSGVVFSKPENVDSTGTGEQTVWTYTLPAGLMARDGDALRVSTTFASTTAATGNKICRLRFDGTAIVLVSITATVPATHFITVMLYRRSTNTQVVHNAYSGSGGNADSGVTNLTANLALAIPLLLSIQSPSAAVGAVAHRGSLVEYLPTS